MPDLPGFKLVKLGAAFQIITIMASPLEWITGVGGAVSGVVNGLFQHKQNKDNLKAQQEENEKNRQFNAAQANLAYQRSVQQWQRENAYNTPAAQRGRLQAAGMNPDLAYDGASGAMASYSGSSAASSSGGITPPSPVSFNEAFQNILQSRMLEAQIKNIEADTKLKTHEGTMLESKAAFADAFAKQELEGNAVSISLNKALASCTDAQKEMVRASIVKLNQECEVLKDSQEVLRKQCEGLEQDIISKKIHNFIDSESASSIISDLANRAKISAAEAETALSRYLTDIAVGKSSARLNNAHAETEEQNRDNILNKTINEASLAFETGQKMHFSYQSEKSYREVIESGSDAGYFLGLLDKAVTAFGHIIPSIKVVK